MQSAQPPERCRAEHILISNSSYSLKMRMHAMHACMHTRQPSPEKGDADALLQGCIVAGPGALAYLGRDAINEEIEQKAYEIGCGVDSCKGCLHAAAAIDAQQGGLKRHSERRSNCMHSRVIACAVMSLP